MTEQAIEHLSFRPMRGLESPHLQTILATFMGSRVAEPPSVPTVISLADGDALYCLVSTPPSWTPKDKTILILHGLGGTCSSGYIVRHSRKFYQQGYRVVRMNLRGIGLGASLAKRPYHGGLTDDILQAIEIFKNQHPDSPIILLGFSLGGNLALKLGGELGERGKGYIDKTIAVCPPIDLAYTTRILLKGANRFYNRYYLYGLKRMAKSWIQQGSIRSVPEFDNAVTAPQWGFRDADDYYQQSSSCFFLSKIRHPCHIIFASDDPFVDYRKAVQERLDASVKISLSSNGGHMGFLGWAGKEHRYFWLDHYLMTLIKH